jgi:hypothetical protein
MQVDFLHRTARDFLVTGTMQGYLEDRAGGSFRPEATLSRIFLVHAKTIPLSGTVVLSSKELYRLYGDNFQWAAGNVMYYTWKHELKYGETMFDLIVYANWIALAMCSVRLAMMKPGLTCSSQAINSLARKHRLLGALYGTSANN